MQDTSISKSKKTALVVVDNSFRIHNNDEWDSFRAEGRIPINIGFGLSLLNYDVNIVYHGWSLNTPKKTWNNIQLSKIPIQNKYDIMMSFGLFNPNLNVEFNKGICIIYEQCHITNAKNFTKSTNTPLIFAYQHKLFIDKVKYDTKENIQYLPLLYPIPSINIGFVPLHYNPNSNELKIFLIHTSWEQNTTISGDRFTTKEELIISHLKNKGYNIKLSVLIVNKELINQFPQSILSNKNTTIFYSNECNYHKIIELIQDADICITNGAPIFPGNSLTDIIALGKPLIYIGDGRLNVEWKQDFVSHLYACPEDIIYIQEPYHDSIQKIDRIMSNPVDSCKKYINEYKDFDFNNWKHIVKYIFS